MRKLMLALLLLFPMGVSAQEEPSCPMIPAVQIDQLRQEKNVLFLDVREPKELEELGTMEGYLNIPIKQLESRLDELPKDRPILVA